MRKYARTAGFAALTGMLVSACAGTQESGPTQVFQLSEVGGQPLPVSYPEEQGCTEEILAATLELEADGEWEMRMTKREVCGETVEEDDDVEEGTYTVEGDVYRFVGPSGDSGSASPGEIEIEGLVEGRLVDGVLTARLKDGSTVVFRR